MTFEFMTVANIGLNKLFHAFPRQFRYLQSHKTVQFMAHKKYKTTEIQPNTFVALWMRLCVTKCQILWSKFSTLILKVTIVLDKTAFLMSIGIFHVSETSIIYGSLRNIISDAELEKFNLILN